MPKTSLPLALALARDGVVTRSALTAGGVDDDLGDRLVRDGAWTRLAPSVYLTSSAQPTDAQLVEAARAHVGPHLVVTGLVACRALDLPYVPDERVVEVVIPPGTRVVSSPYVVVHQSGREQPTWSRSGVAYAMPARAVVDGGRRLTDLRTVRALLLGAACKGLASGQELADEVEAGAQRGSALVRRAAEDALAGAWSAPEAEAADLVSAAVRQERLPPFLLNPLVLRGGRRVGLPDGWIPGAGVGWQMDSHQHHSALDDFDRTLAVHDGFAEHGLTLLHVTPRRLRQLGSAWVDLLCAAVEARPRVAEPADLTIEPRGPLQTGSRRYRLLTPSYPR